MLLLSKIIIGEDMNFGVLSKYRSTLMGFAILWVMFFHISLDFQTELGWFIHRIGFYGVDIFLFVSGIGVYFSLTKRPNVIGFYKARLIRILPAYIIVACLSFFLLRPDGSGVLHFIYYISGLGYWTRHIRFDWYIPTQIAFYLITPLFLCFYKKISEKSRVAYTVLWMTLSPIITAIFYYADLKYLWGSTVRLAIFFLGIHMGSLVYEKKTFGKGTVALSFAAFVIGTCAAYFINKVKEPTFIQSGLNCYPALIMIPSMCLLISFGLSVLDRKFPRVTKYINLPFEILGRYSLELYLLHQRLQSILSRYLEIHNQCLILIVTVVAALILGKTISIVQGVLKTHRKKAII